MGYGSDMPTDYMSTAEVMADRKVNRKTVYRWVATGRLVPAMKLPGGTGAYLFRREDVHAITPQRAAS